MNALWISSMFVGLLLLGACQGGQEMNEGGAASIPIHLEIPAGKLQPVMGVSGFIFGNFLLLNAYLIIIASLILLIIKDEIMQKLVVAVRTALHLLDPKLIDSKAMIFLGTLTGNDTRVQYGAIGLIAGLILAYFGAWIAL